MALAKLVEDVPMTTPEKALWYIEYVIRHKGAKHLNYPQKDIPFYQYHYYDIALSAVVVISFIMLLIMLLIYGAFKIALMMIRRQVNSKVKRE